MILKKKSRISLNKIVYIYLVLPVIIFMLTWIRLSIGIPAALLVIGALFLVVGKAEASPITFSRRTIFITIAIAFVWCFFAGQGGFWYQSGDHAYRNAIFRDMVFHQWPVVFEKQNVLLNYYIGYWLVPALFGKVILFTTQNTSIAWLGAKIILLFWTTLGVVLCFLLLTTVLHCESKKRFYAAIIVFVCFSGLDIIGIYLLNKQAALHLEWWCPGYQYSAFTVCLFWVYNQAIPAWIATLLLLSERKVENFAFCGLIIIISSPIPLVGLFPIYLITGIQELIKAERKGVVVKKIFSLQNIIACMVIFPICLTYFCDNAAVSMKGVSQVKAPVIEQPASNQIIPQKAVVPPKADSRIVRMIKASLKLVIFFGVEFVIYLLLIFKKQKKSLLFWCITLELFIIPFIHIGFSNDFCMRASIPPLVVLMTMVFDDFYENFEKRSYKFTIYCIVLAFAVLTPAKEFYRGAFEIYKHRQFADNRIISIEKTISATRKRNNFISYDYSKSVFYKYLARKNKKTE